MDGEKLVLDRKSFGALAVDSRVNILKALRERRKTLSELSQELGQSVSTTKEHLQKLEEAELIKKMEEGHKWKYYRLTRKGEQIVSPNTEVRVWILLAVSAMAFLYSALTMYAPFSQVHPSAAQMEDFALGELETKAFASETEPTGLTAGSDAPKQEARAQVAEANPDILPSLMLLASGSIFFISIFYLLRKKFV